MSSFVGFLRLGDRPIERRDLDRGAQALPRNGATQAAIWLSGSMGLAHRLFVITPEDRFERQPYSNRNRTRHLVFAGRLDNRDELAGALEVPAASLREMPDSALCLAAFDRWGDDAPSRLFGGYAAALWDESARRLVLCRDHMGERTLFFHRDGSHIAFATTFNALLALPDVPRVVDETALGEFLGGDRSGQARTVYKGIERVPSGSLAIFERGGARVHPFWVPKPRSLGIRRYEDIVEAAREHLDRSVAPMLRSENPVAAEATGGLDSSGVAATAARLLAPGRLSTYTRVPPPDMHFSETGTTYFDERAPVAALARMHPNIDATYIDNAEPHPFDAEPAQMFAATGIPVLTSANLGWLAQLRNRVTADGHRVLLTGQPGNFSLGWRGANRIGELIRTFRLIPALRELHATARITGRSWPSVLHTHVGPLEPLALRRWRRPNGNGSQAAFVNPQFALEHVLRDRVESQGRFERDSFAARMQWLVRANEMTRDWRGQTVALYGIELRNPLGDPRLIEFSLNVPEKFYLREGRPRALQRDTLADRVPPQIRDNYKHGDQCPEWFSRFEPQRDAVFADIERIAHSPAACRMIDVPRLRGSAENWPASAEEAERRRTELCYGMMRALHIGRFVCWLEGSNQ